MTGLKCYPHSALQNSGKPQELPAREGRGKENKNVTAAKGSLKHYVLLGTLSVQHRSTLNFCIFFEISTRGKHVKEKPITIS